MDGDEGRESPGSETCRDSCERSGQKRVGNVDGSGVGDRGTKIGSAMGIGGAGNSGEKTGLGSAGGGDDESADDVTGGSGELITYVNIGLFFQKNACFSSSSRSILSRLRSRPAGLAISLF